MRSVTLLLAIAALTAALARPAQHGLATGALAVSSLPYLPGSAIGANVAGFAGPYGLALVGSGGVAGATYRVAPGATAGLLALIAGNAHGLATQTVRVAPAPDAGRALVAVAAYDDGIDFHDAKTFAERGLLATAGAPSDVAIDAHGRVVTTDTDGDALTVATLQPWTVGRIRGVPLGDEIAIDGATGDIFATDRDIGGPGALTRVSPAGQVTRVVTGTTAEGLAIDERRGLVYVANVNDATIAVVDARTMRVRRTFATVPRVFSVVLSPDGSRLYAVSNQSAASPFAAAGSVAMVALDGERPKTLAHSADLVFPIGAALDPAAGRLFVTDEQRDAIYVLDARTLRAQRPPLRTCRTPWKPYVDLVDRRLYIPCAREDRVDVFDLHNLRRLRGAPFASAGYPLAVAVWHPARAAAPPRR